MSDLYCKDLCMTFADPMSGSKVEALKDIQFNLKEGEILTVLGPSGCGKTTLLNMVTGFITPTSGTLTLGGVMIFRRRAPNAAWCFSRAPCSSGLLARNVDFGLRMKGVGEEDPEAGQFLARHCGSPGFCETPSIVWWHSSVLRLPGAL